MTEYIVSKHKKSRTNVKLIFLLPYCMHIIPTKFEGFFGTYLCMTGKNLYVTQKIIPLACRF